MMQWGNRQQLLSRVFGVFASLGGLSALVAIAALLLGSNWTGVVGVMILTILFFGVAGTAAARCVVISVNASRRELSKRITDVTVQLTNLGTTLSAAVEVVGDVHQTASALPSNLSEIDLKLTRSIGMTNRSIIRLDTTLQSLDCDLDRRLGEQANAFERAAFNVARSQRRLEFEVLKGRGMDGEA